MNAPLTECCLGVAGDSDSCHHAEVHPVRAGQTGRRRAARDQVQPGGRETAPR